MPELPEIEADLEPPTTKDLEPGLPNLEIKELPPLPSETPELPSEHPKEPNQEKIKQVINPPEHHDMQRSEFKPITPHEEIKPHEVEIIETTPAPKPKTYVKEGKPVYIRLDKFKTTAETFAEIKDKIIDIERLLKKTKEIKDKEEREIEEWEREIQIMKSRIESVDRDVFNKLD